jgi:NAD(P)-dependent dehydrogenase (short-subunit alcohol dehydrogenase family)
MRLDAKVALITGGSRGIGRAIAETFVAAGARVMITGRDPQSLEETRAALGSDNAAWAGDASDEAQARECVAETMRRFGRIDILVNNAGGSFQRHHIMDMPLAEFDATWALNVRTPLMWTQLVWRSWMAQAGGVVINMSSLGGISLQPGMGAYCASKAALNHLTRMLAADLGPTVRVNAIAPGLIKTEQSAPAWTNNEAAIASRMPLGRLGESVDIAQAALFLASDASSWITGEVLIVDGGANVQLGRSRRK